MLWSLVCGPPIAVVSKEANRFRDIAIILVIGNTQQAVRPIRYHFRVDEISDLIYRDILGGPRDAENHCKIPLFVPILKV